MNFLSFLFIAFIVSYLFRSFAKGLIPLSDKVMLRLWGLSGADDQEVLRRRPRGAVAWNYFQAVILGITFSLLIGTIRDSYVEMGGTSWFYSLLAIMWAMTAGAGFRVNPGTVFLSCFVGVVLYLGWGTWGSAAAGSLFMLITLRLLIKKPNSKRDPSEPFVVDVDPID